MGRDIQRMFYDRRRAILKWFYWLKPSIWLGWGRSVLRFTPFDARHSLRANLMRIFFCISLLLALNGLINYFIFQNLASGNLSINTGMLISLGVLIFCIVVIMVGSSIVVLRIMRPLEKVSKNLDALAHGRLDTRFIVNREDELEVLAHNLNMTADSLKKTIIDIREHCATLGVAVLGIHNTAEAQQDEANHGNLAIEKAIDTLDNLSRITERIGITSTDLARICTDEKGRILVYQHALNVAREKMEAIRNRVTQADRLMAGLTEASGRITTIMGRINDMSAQTHMLALNAQIEAAGATVYGKRFAVVADEVKQLAATVQQASVDVRSSIENLTNVATMITLTMMDEHRDAEESLEQVTTASNVHVLLEGLLEQTFELADETSRVVQQQKTANEQLSNILLNMTETVNVTIKDAQETVRSTDDMLRSIDELRTHTERFQY